MTTNRQSFPANVQAGLARKEQEAGETFDEINFGGSQDPEYLRLKAEYIQDELKDFLLLMKQAGLEGYRDK